MLWHPRSHSRTRGDPTTFSTHSCNESSSFLKKKTPLTFKPLNNLSYFFLFKCNPPSLLRQLSPQSSSLNRWKWRMRGIPKIFFHRTFSYHAARTLAFKKGKRCSWASAHSSNYTLYASELLLEVRRMQEITFLDQLVVSAQTQTLFCVSAGDEDVLNQSPYSSWNLNKSAHASSYPSIYLQTPV